MSVCIIGRRYINPQTPITRTYTLHPTPYTLHAGRRWMSTVLRGGFADGGVIQGSQSNSPPSRVPSPRSRDAAGPGTECGTDTESGITGQEERGGCDQARERGAALWG